MANSVEFNEQFFIDLANSAGVVNLCRGAADRIAQTARATAPVDTGAYRDSIHVEIEQRSKMKAAVVVADDEKAMIIESKTGNLVRALNKAKRG